MVEAGFWPLAKRLYAEAKSEAKARTEKATAASGDAPRAGAPNDAPSVTAEQLVGKECVRFQGLRVAYFALDKDSRVATLDEPDNVEAGRREGDFLVLNRIVSLKEDAGKSS
ncbi:hypothetical protein HDZ31DRAFT_48050 [Schizophyllum fasciatum]